MGGGEFGVNTGGLSHYLRFGHHGVLARGLTLTLTLTQTPTLTPNPNP